MIQSHKSCQAETVGTVWCFLSSGPVGEIVRPALSYIFNIMCTWSDYSLLWLHVMQTSRSASLAITLHISTRVLTCTQGAHFWHQCSLRAWARGHWQAREAYNSIQSVFLHVWYHPAWVFLHADSSSCCISGWCPVPRPSCPVVHLDSRNSGKPRGAVGRLQPQKTSSSAPGGIECRSHSRTDVTSPQKQDIGQMWQLLLRLTDECVRFQRGIKMWNLFSYSWVHYSTLYKS